MTPMKKLCINIQSVKPMSFSQTNLPLAAWKQVCEAAKANMEGFEVQLEHDEIVVRLTNMNPKYLAIFIATFNPVVVLRREFIAE